MTLTTRSGALHLPWYNQQQSYYPSSNESVLNATTVWPNLVPHDVTTHWNSTYDMLVFSFWYQEPIDHITSDKSLKQAKRFELDDDKWKIITDLIAVLGVSSQSISRPLDYCS